MVTDFEFQATQAQSAARKPFSSAHPSSSKCSRALQLVGSALLCVAAQLAPAAETATSLYAQCRAKPTTAEQRDCYPMVVKQSELELVAAEKKVRADMVELEKISEGSRSLHPVRAFDKTARAFRAFRAAESTRVLTSYGSGNGGGLAAWEAEIQMNLARTKLLLGSD